MEAYFIELTQSHVGLAYGFLFLSAFVENVFPPVPGDTVTLAGAYFVGVGALSFTGVLISTTAGSLAGFMTLFAIAYRMGWRFFAERDIPWLKATYMDRVDRWFIRFGYGIIFANRFLPGVRSVISISAGLSKLRIVPVMLLAALSAALWNSMFIYLGAVVGRSKEEILAFLTLYNRTFFILLGVVVLAVLITVWVRRRRANAS